MNPLLKRKGEILEMNGSTTEARAVFAEAIASIERLPESRRGTDACRRMEAGLRAKLDPK